MVSMEIAKPNPDAQEQTRSHTDWVADYWRLLHPGIILAVSFVTAGAVFLTGPELTAIAATETAILKLFVGAALLFFVGYFFTYKLASGRTRSETQYLLHQNAEDIALMRSAFETARQRRPKRIIAARKKQSRRAAAKKKPAG